MDKQNDTPFGYCRCGCGAKTRIAPKTSRERGWVRGEPQPYLSGHGTKGKSKYKRKPCACGCGELTSPGATFRHGHWARVRPKPDPAQVFWSKVDQQGPDDCWVWQAFRDKGGYGMAWHPKQKRMVQAHRRAYELVHGPLEYVPGRNGAAGDCVCHHCDNPPCCNPKHLFLGTHKENMEDMVSKGRVADNSQERNPKAKLTAADVSEIRQGYTGQHGEKMAIARKYGISSGHVSKILSGDVWR